MINFDYCNPTRYIFGKDTQHQVGELISQYGGTKVLLHYGGGSVKKSGLYDDVVKSLKQSKVEFIELGGAQPNPRSGLVYKGVALCKKEGVDFILAIGGGSTIDSAKAIAMGAANDCDFWDFFCEKETLRKCLPVCTILTLPAAGSEGSTGSVITHEDGMFKRGFNNQLLYPVFSILNPELTYTLPAYQTACGVADIIAHAFERYITQTQDVFFSDRLCESVVLTMLKYAPIAIANPQDYAARSNIMWAGTLVHNNLLGKGREEDWCTHAIEHELSALYDVAHGAGLAVMFPAFIRYQYKQNVELFADLFVHLFGIINERGRSERTVLEGVKRLEQFFASIGLPTCFEELGAKKEDIPMMAAKVVVDANGCNSPFHNIKKEDFEKIYYLACKQS